MTQEIVIDEQIQISKDYVAKGLSYIAYRKLIDELLQQQLTTGKSNVASLLDYTKLNVARMNRLDKTIELIPELKEFAAKISAPQTWLVLTEGWCGDAAQIVPVLNKIALLNANINLKFLLRDENLDLMDAYLTNGTSRSIPKLIVLDEDGSELFNWGPRPKEVQEIFYHMKANGADYGTIKEEIHSWYAKDKTVTTQQELFNLMLNTK
jgi:hypothetical protein